MAKEEFERHGACHCGRVKFRVRLKEGLASAHRCNCSLCRRRGAVTVSADVTDLRIVVGEEMLSTYRFNTMTAEHHFCSNCGIYTHHKRRSNPDEFGVNAACLEGVSPFDFAEVMVTDGVHHPSDGRVGSGIAGYLLFEPAE